MGESGNNKIFSGFIQNGIINLKICHISFHVPLLTNFGQLSFYKDALVQILV